MFRRRVPWALTAAVAVAISGCTGSALNPGKDQTTSDTVRIGLILPKSGPYKTAGDDIHDGWQLYLDQHGGKLGGHKVEVVEADEGDGKDAVRVAGKKLLEQDKVDVLVGNASAETVLSLDPMLRQHGVPMIGTGGRPSTITDPTYIWHTSWLSQETGAAIADYLRTTVDGPVFAIGPDYVGGHDQITGFTKAFTAKGGKLANPGGEPEWTPWAPTPTTNFQPYLAKIKSSGAKAVYTFYAGSSAVEFVKQYKQFGVDLPLYAAGFLTDGAVLAAEGPAAEGISTVLNYAANIDTDANRRFVAAFTAQHSGATPNIYHVCGWDAAMVLDMALTQAGAATTATSAPTSGSPTATGTTTKAAPTPPPSQSPTTAAIMAALPHLGEVNSPRGGWQFGPVNHTPVQKWYLRRVTADGGVLANVKIAELATLGS
ncbi:ABC transporter substrate-binding protein [Hamadaea sp. NPDC050747]|uniref:ABC transporter substrate-binding protein n=1 Tax=Hamadaea sp. NPDC050747 TaxID=3155789 RepID=UPI0033E010C6